MVQKGDAMHAANQPVVDATAPLAVEVVDVAFEAKGTVFPLDHGYALYSALCRLLPKLHDSGSWGVHLIRGSKSAVGTLKVEARSLVRLRLPSTALHETVPLVGATLQLGEHSLTLGGMRVFPLGPSPALRAPLVIIKNHMEPESFLNAAREQLTHLRGLDQPVEKIGVVVGQRRVMKIGQHTVVGFALGLDGLSVDSSIAIQAQGIGGRRHMGAGLFLPAKR
jgi:CRISPR-associated protein Cas6